MAARFPQSGTSLAWRIKPAWASKIHVFYWAAGADSAHRLRSGDTASTVITRSASGCTFNSTEGRTEGDATVWFTDSIAGGYGALRETDNWTIGISYWGDLFDGIPSRIMFSTAAPPDGFFGGSSFRASGNAFKPCLGSSIGDIANLTSGFNTNAAHFIVAALRRDDSDATARHRVWINGSENTGARNNSTSLTSTSLMGDSGRPFYFGDNEATSANTRLDFEAAWFGPNLSDADMASITADPTVAIEESPASANARLTGGKLVGGFLVG